MGRKIKGDQILVQANACKQSKVPIALSIYLADENKNYHFQ
jgi:hypothetical protein